MEKNAGGSLWRIDLATGGGPAAWRSDLAFPYGILIRGRRAIVVAESWRHRLIAVPRQGGAPQPLLTKLPGYPARLAPAADGGAWLALFAPRNRLIEFVLLEDDYRAAMMREIDRASTGSRRRSPPAPASSSRCRCGGVKTMGIHKPWSPSRSYGLVVRLDAALQPVASFHSRANGRRHGITSVIEAGGQVLAASQGRQRHPRHRRARGGRRMTVILETRKLTKAYRGVPAIKDIDFDAAGRRDPRPARRERRRQVDPHQDHGRRRRRHQRQACSIAARR